MINSPKSLQSAAFTWAALRPFIAAERRLGRLATRRPHTAKLYELMRFGLKQGWACLFGAVMLALLLGSHRWYPREASLPRYDFLVIAAVTAQVLMLLARLETLEEAFVILLFHVTGTVMEIFKTSVGSWIYPEPSLLRIGGVPLFTGFMYACVGSYIARAWRLFDFRFTNHPPLWATLILAGAVYANFFGHHYIADLRWVLFLATFLLFGRCFIYFKVWRIHRRMPLLIGWALVAFFIWIAENIGTFTSTWLYPSQLHGWSPVGIAKLGSWFLLLIISYVLVTLVNRPKAMQIPVAAPAQSPELLAASRS